MLLAHAQHVRQFLINCKTAHQLGQLIVGLEPTKQATKLVVVVVLHQALLGSALVEHSELGVHVWKALCWLCMR